MGNTLQKWDKRWFVLSGGTSQLNYYKSERDAARGNPPAGSVECMRSQIERIAMTSSNAWGNAGYNIEFVLHTEERVLGLRAASEDAFRLWVSAIVTAGGRAPLQKNALSV